MSDTDKAMTIIPEWLDKSKHYAWVPSNETVMAGYQADGYQIVKATDPDAAEFKKHEDVRLASDGKIRVGDAVLMRVDKKLYTEAKSAIRERNRRALRSVREDFHASAHALGVPSYNDDAQ